jgi:two-component system sensor histidine kinase HydH
MSNRLMVRMIAPIGAVSVLLVTLGGAAAWYVHRLQKNTSDVLALNVASVGAAEQLQIGLLEVRGLLQDYRYTGDRKYLAGVPALRRQTDQSLREAERLATTPREQELIAEVKRGYGRFFGEFDRLAEQKRPGSPSPEELRTLAEEVLAKEILRPVREYLDYNEQMAARNSEQNQAMSHHVALALVLLGACGAVAGLLAGYGIARGIARSIVQLSLPIRDAAGKLNEVVGPVTVTAGRNLQELESTLHKLAEQVGTVVERLHESQREVLRAEQLAAVGQMAAGLAHELRNPLMSMKVLVQPVVERGTAVNLSQRDLEVLDEEITRLEGLIQTFLDFARPPQPEKRPFELQGVLEQTVVLVSGRAEHQGVRIEGARPVVPVVIDADMGQVRQVLLNLLLNALDATPEGGRVTVQVQRERGGEDRAVPGPAGLAGPGEWLTIQVADTGRGLPRDLGPRIFEPFVSTKETGLGLGLSICKRIVEAHGGEITAADRPEGGAVFTVWLPLRPSTVPALPRGRSNQPACRMPD